MKFYFLNKSAIIKSNNRKKRTSLPEELITCVEKEINHVMSMRRCVTGNCKNKLKSSNHNNISSCS
ncbi:hypothetical protein HZS_188 [Henneguya salminicola]|nr:hypothetical protein HZS_188 [Henneguya salminicola]